MDNCFWTFLVLTSSVWARSLFRCCFFNSSSVFFFSTKIFNSCTFLGLFSPFLFCVLVFSFVSWTFPCKQYICTKLPDPKFMTKICTRQETNAVNTYQLFQAMLQSILKCQAVQLYAELLQFRARRSQLWYIQWSTDFNSTSPEVWKVLYYSASLSVHFQVLPFSYLLPLFYPINTIPNS